MAIFVLYVKIMLHDNTFATGPVTTEDFHEFLFRNTGSSLDLYFSLRKNGMAWTFSSGINVPQTYIEQVGQQIDKELVTI